MSSASATAAPAAAAANNNNHHHHHNNNNGGVQGRASCCHRFCEQVPTPMSVRRHYALLFLVSNVLAWVARESHAIASFEGRLQHSSDCHGNHDCLAADAVLLISLNTFMFFSVMFFSTVTTSKIQDVRNTWHCQWWVAKLILLACCISVSTMLPVNYIHLYGKAAPFGAGVFLVIQLLSVIRYITRFTNGWCRVDTGNRPLQVIALCILLYSACLVALILMASWYIACWLNFKLICTTALLVYIIMPLISLMSEAKLGFLVGPGLVGVYILWLCFSAIKSEPETECYEKEKAGAGANWQTMLFFFAGLVATAVSAFSTGSDYKCIQLRNIEVLEDDVPYGYGLFHFIFATGSMYFSMVLLGWDTHRRMEKWNMDVSWTSMWVHIVNEGLAVISYVAILVARMNELGWLQQLLARIFGIGEPPPAPAPQQQQQQQQQQEMVIINLSSSSSDDGGHVPPPSSPVSPTTTTREVRRDNAGRGGPPPVSETILHGDDVASSSTSTVTGAGAEPPSTPRPQPPWTAPRDIHAAAGRSSSPDEIVPAKDD